MAGEVHAGRFAVRRTVAAGRRPRGHGRPGARLAREMGGGRYAQFAAALATALAPAYVGICGILSMNAFDILFWAALWLDLGPRPANGRPAPVAVVRARGRPGPPEQDQRVVPGVRSRLRPRAEPALARVPFLAALGGRRSWHASSSCPTSSGSGSTGGPRWSSWRTPPGRRTCRCRLRSVPGRAGDPDGRARGAALDRRACSDCWQPAISRPSGRSAGPTWPSLAVMLATNAKPYYLAAAYTALFAAGAVLVEAIPRSMSPGPCSAPVVVLLVVAGGAASLPFVKPVLSTDAFLRYAAALGDGARAARSATRWAGFRSSIADMHGWEDLAVEPRRRSTTRCPRRTASAPASSRRTTARPARWTSSERLSDCREPSRATTATFSGDRAAARVTSSSRIGGERKDYEEVFASVEQAAVHTCTDCMPYENNLPIWRGFAAPACRSPPIWPRVEAVRLTRRRANLTAYNASMPLPEAAPRAEKVSRPSVPALDAMLGDADPRPRRRVRARRRLHGRRLRRRAGGADVVRQGHQAPARGPRPAPLPDAPRPHDAVRDVRAQAARARPDGRVAPVDPASHGERERVLHPLFRGDRRGAAHRSRRVAPAVRRQPPGQQRAAAAWSRARGCRTRRAALQRQARDIYEARLAAGVAREQARKDLPLSTYTEAYWKIDLQNLLHFLELRMDEHAQQEIRAYANVIGNEIVAKWVPLTWEAFLDYRRGGTRLSRIESAFLAALASGERERAVAIAEEGGFLTPRRRRPAQAEPRGPRTRRETGAPGPQGALGIDASWAAHGGPSRLPTRFAATPLHAGWESSPLHPSTAAVADGHLVVFDDDRDVAAALAVAEHPLQAGGVLLHVDVLDRVAALCEDLTGLRRVGSGVLAEDEHVHRDLRDWGLGIGDSPVTPSRCNP